MAANNWYVITGGPSTGKTTLLSALKKRGHKTFPEAARVMIDEALKKGITVEKFRENEVEFQMNVLRRIVRMEEAHDGDVLTFFDRGRYDALGFLKLHGAKIKGETVEIANKARYRKVFLLEPLGKYMKDYARTESREQALRLNRLLYDEYDSAGMTPVVVPATGLEERAEFVLQHVDEHTKLN